MSDSITQPQIDALGRPVARAVYFVELAFIGSTQRFCTRNHNIDWNGATWFGLGPIAKISAVSLSETLESTALTFTFAADPSWIALAVGDVTVYRGQPARMYMCPLDDAYNMVGTPIPCWTGVMDTVGIGIDGEAGSITLKCEGAAYAFRRASTLRNNAAQQRLIDPTDTAFQHLSGLISTPTLWLSKKFQI